MLVKLSFFFFGSQNWNFVKLYSVSDRYAWLLREWLHWEFRLSVTLREQHVLPVFENKVVKNVSEFKKGILNVQLRIFFTCAEAGHDFDCETLEKTADWVQIFNNGDTRCSYCTWRPKKKKLKRNWGGGVREYNQYTEFKSFIKCQNCTFGR